MLPPDVAANAADFVRVLAARHGEDPRLVASVATEWSFVRAEWVVVVSLVDGRRGMASLPVEPGRLGHDDLRRGVAEAAGQSFALGPPPSASGFAASGLPSDYWWNELTMERADEARRWVKDVLLGLPQMSDAHADRFIASLDPPKREELVRRAMAATTAVGF